MGALVPNSQWIPEDDFLLKNAVEAGASLESLAKGAVQFSRRFTVEELQDRWYSLLYDPVVSEQASAEMIGLELSASTSQSKVIKLEKENKITCSSVKRKSESIRKCYYSMRKRICTEPYEMMGANIISETGVSNFRDGNEPSSGDFVIGNPRASEENISCPGDQIGLPGFSSSKESPLFNLFETEGLDNEGNICSSSLQQMPMSSNITRHLSHSTEDYIVDLSNILFDFSNEEELLLMDADGEGFVDKSYIDGFSSLLLDFPKQGELHDVGAGEAAVAAVESFVGTTHVHSTSDPPSAQVYGPEYRNGVICCTLNTEDQEIPSNDDVFLPFRFPSPSNSSGAHWRSHDSRYLEPSSIETSSSTRRADGGPFMLKTAQKETRVLSHAMGSPKPSVLGSNYVSGECGVKFGFPESNIQHATLRDTILSPNTFIAEAVKGGAMEMERGKNLFSKSSVPCPDMHVRGSGVPLSSQNFASGSRNAVFPKAGIVNSGSSIADLRQKRVVTNAIEKSPISDQEELCSENDDVPYFSDVEAMILDMDLSPDEFDLSTNAEVQKYRHDVNKRTIIRLEQAVDACMQRAMAAQGALAVLYSRHSRHFIKKPEVILGRATEDVKVDIDLGREKDGGKFSRRQAIIKMDTLGTFHLKNFGKCPIDVNGKTIAPGQSLSLVHGCLIEIRKLAFVFETNPTHVKQYVNSIKDRSLSLETRPAA